MTGGKRKELSGKIRKTTRIREEGESLSLID